MSTPLRERPDAPLGTLIFPAGLLPAETIENALEEGVKTGRRLGEILIERGLLQEEDLTRLLAGQKGLPFVTLRSEPVDPEATKLLSEDQARLFSALPIRFEEGQPLSFELHVEVRPEIKLDRVEGFRVTRARSAVTDETVL